MAKTIKRGETEMKVSSMNFQVKEVGVPEDRCLRFIGSDATPDRDGDVISPDGWDLSNYEKNPVFLWAHDYSIPPVGKSTKTWKEKGKLMFDIQFPEKGIYPFADLVYNLYKGGFLNATSVGFIGKDAEARDDEDVKDLPEWKRGLKFNKQELLELSAVPVPSNPAALQQAKSVGAVTEDEFTSLMSFINGDFVQNPHIGAKTLKGIQNVYEAQEETEPEQKEVGDVSKEKGQEMQLDFLVNPSTKKTLLVNSADGKILGDVTEGIKSLVSQAVEVAVKAAKAEFEAEEKAGAALSKKNKSRLSQAKDLIIEVLGQVEDEQSIEDQKDPAVLEDEEELTNPEDVSMDGKKKSKGKDDKPKGEDEKPEDEDEDEDNDEDEEEGTEDKPKKKKSAEDDFVFELTDDKPSDGSVDLKGVDVQALIKSAVAAALQAKSE